MKKYENSTQPLEVCTRQLSKIFNHIVMAKNMGPLSALVRKCANSPRKWHRHLRTYFSPYKKRCAFILTISKLALFEHLAEALTEFKIAL